jgi:hypothetical protein
MKSAQGDSTPPRPGYQDGIETPIFTWPNFAKARQEFVNRKTRLYPIVSIMCQEIWHYRYPTSMPKKPGNLRGLNKYMFMGQIRKASHSHYKHKPSISI